MVGFGFAPRVRAHGSHGSRGGSRNGGAAVSAMSLRQLARVIGVSDTAVRKAEGKGVFGDAVRRDGAGEPGVVDVVAALAAWERSGRQLRGSKAGRQDGAAATPLLPPAPAAAADGMGDELPGGLD